MNSASTSRPVRSRSITSSVRKAGIVAAVAGGVSLLCAGVVLAGDHWLSTSGQLLGLNGPNTDPDQGSARAATRRVAKSPINIVIALHSDPQEGREQAHYELIIESFADAIYEATNGAHQLGNVRIYTKFRYAQRADVVWGESGWPTAAPNGLGIRGQHIYMFDQFGDVNFLENSKNRAKGGYLLAHNSAHYSYGLYDEHAVVASSDQLDDSAPHAVDIPVEPSIMNDPLNAADLTGEARYKWLNFSSLTETPPGEFANTQATAQHRMHGVSGWATLIRKPGQDPRSGRLLSRPTRVYWPDLVRAAPDPAARWKQDLPDEAARERLDIIWEESEVVYEIVLDRSGSMSYEDKLENAKTGLGW
ncbi:MAG: hypothetical protein IID39_01600, partial [Planctomycetes bacterium]|nr:hypothetical protein [Planctomycetota bacterium]